MSRGITIEQTVHYPDAPAVNVKVSYQPIQPKSEDAKNYFKIYTPSEYYDYVVNPLMHSEDVQQKVTKLHAFPLGHAEEYVTLNKYGRDETGRPFGDHAVADPKTNSKNNAFLVFSAQDYTIQQATMAFLTINQMAGMAKANLQSEDMLAIIAGEQRYKLNIAAYGMWTMSGNDLNNKYIMKGGTGTTFEPKPESWRAFAQVPAIDGYDGINIPTSWGDFNIDTGGHMALAADEYDKVADAYHASGLTTEQRMGQFLNSGEKLVSVFDIYGIEPGFVANNYKPLETLPPAVSANIARLNR